MPKLSEKLSDFVYFANAKNIEAAEKESKPDLYNFEYINPVDFVMLREGDIVHTNGNEIFQVKKVEIAKVEDCDMLIASCYQFGSDGIILAELVDCVNAEDDEFLPAVTLERLKGACYSESTARDILNNYLIEFAVRPVRKKSKQDKFSVTLSFDEFARLCNFEKCSGNKWQHLSKNVAIKREINPHNPELSRWSYVYGSTSVNYLSFKEIQLIMQDLR